MTETYIKKTAKQIDEHGLTDYLARVGMQYDFSEREQAIISEGVIQILEGRGLTLDAPFEKLGIAGCYHLMRILGFAFTAQVLLDYRDDYFYDKLHFEHTQQSWMRVTIYNKVAVTDASKIRPAAR